MDWTGTAAAMVLAAELPKASGAAPHRLEGYISTAGGQWRISAFIVDTSTNKVAGNLIVKGPLTGGILPLAGALARRVDPQARPFSTQNPEALKAYAEAALQQDPTAMAGGFERAVSLDPNFGAAYLSWCELLMGRGDSAGAARIIELARARGGQIGEFDRARLEVDASLLQGDPAAQLRAMIALARYLPQDAALFTRIADVQVQQHQYRAAVEWYKKAVEIDASSEARLNQLGYAQCWARDPDGARATLARYQKLKPRDANPLDSTGDVNFYWGKFADAEKSYLAANQKDPAFLGGGALLKAAHARLMTGDVAGADQIYERYARIRRESHDPLVNYRQAQWDFLCGRRKQAMARIVDPPIMAAGGDIASLAQSQLAIWRLETGADGAREAALRAEALARNTSSMRQATLAAYLIDPQSPALQEPFLRLVAQGYALLFNKQFAAATPVFQQLYDKAAPSDPSPYGVLLAWSMIETGRMKEAFDPLLPNPLPNPEGEDPLESVAFPRLFHLRSAVLGDRGKSSEALAYHQLFLKLSGDMPQTWERK